ncbi:MAG: hypothetical protein IIV74_03275 [Alphaproteobacteria bacterium]|nr:hypothetical protein [Alphaproteobacteria bacterium]
MHKTQEYDISASYLVPAYKLPAGVKTHYLTTVRGQHNHGSIFIDVWLVNVVAGQEQAGIKTALAQELESAKTALQQSVVQDKMDNVKQSEKTAKLTNAVKIFENLVSEHSNPVYHKQPDAEFIQIAQQNLMYGNLRQYEPNMNHAVYLAGLSRYSER